MTHHHQKGSTTMDQRWFGREPALIIQGVAVILTMLIAFGVPGLNDGLVAAITAVLVAGAAAYTALHVRPIAPSVFAAVIGAAATLLASLGYHLSQQQTGAVTATVAVLMAILTRQQQTPIIPAAALARRN